MLNNIANTIVQAVINSDIPEELALDQYVATTEFVEPTLPECLTDSLEDFEDPLFVPGDGCSLAAQLGVEPSELDTVIDTSLLSTYDENQQDETEALEEAEQETEFRRGLQMRSEILPRISSRK